MVSRAFGTRQHCVGSKKHKCYVFYSPPCVIISDMQPENSQHPATAAENLPMPPKLGPEQVIGEVPSLPPLETGLEAHQERSEQVAETRAIANDMAAPSTATAVVTPVAPTQAPMDNTSAASSTPLVAADEDVIEKEWVDKAKDIVSKTKDDPHARSEQVDGLRKDYQQKRFGKVAGASQ